MANSENILSKRMALQNVLRVFDGEVISTITKIKVGSMTAMQTFQSQGDGFFFQHGFFF